MRDGNWNRWRIEAVLTTRSVLHVGSGEELPMDDRGGPVEEGEEHTLSAVAVDAMGRPYIPGTSLKGALRHWLEDRLGDPERDRLIPLFGTPSTERADPLGGRIAVWDAFLDEAAVPLAPGRSWSEERGTDLRASVSLDHETGTAIPGRLFHEEVVLPGSRFRVVITGDDLDETDVAILTRALCACTDAVPMRLGGGTSHDHGLLECPDETLALRRLDDDCVDAWLQGSACSFEGFPLVAADLRRHILALRGAVPVTPAPPRLELDVDIAFEGPFLVNDASRVTEGGVDHTWLRTQDGEVLLPARSLRGAMRHRTAAIGRTLGYDETDIDAFLVSVFGAVDRRGRLCIADLAGATETEQRQEFVAIDRFTGGVSGSKKFDAQAALAPTLSGRLTLALEDPLPDAALGLLALTIKDLASGQVALGWGRSKAYGQCALRVTGVRLHGSRDLPASLSSLAEVLCGGLDLSGGLVGLPDEAREVVRSLVRAARRERADA